MWVQRKLALEPRSRGLHLVTDEVLRALPEVRRVAAGLLHVFVMHTSASLTLTENASPAVRRDLDGWLDRAVPESGHGWTHTSEGSDDMPAHVKSSLLGCGLIIPVGEGRLLLGTWQGVCLGEHRDAGGARSLVLTLWGEDRATGG